MFPAFFYGYVLIHVIQNKVFGAICRKDMFFLEKEVIFDVRLGPNIEWKGNKAFNSFFEDRKTSGNWDEQ
jgi:hypothetical protein